MSAPTPQGSPSRLLLWSALATIYVVWGSTYLAIRVMVEDIPPLLGAGVRFLIAGLIVCAWLRVKRGPGALHLTTGQVGACLLVGVLLLFGGNGLVTLAERDVPSGLAALIIASVPLWVVVLRAAARERISVVTLLGVAVGFAGVAILAAPGERPDGATTLGIVLLIGAAASWATGSFISKRLPLPRDAFLATGVQMVLGGLAMALSGLAAGESSQVDLGAVSAGPAAAWLYLITFGSLLAFTAYTWLLKNAPISKVATYAYVNPAVAVFLGWAILSEEVTTTTLVGSAVIVASVALVVRTESAPPRAERTPERGPTPEPGVALRSS